MSHTRLQHIGHDDWAAFKIVEPIETAAVDILLIEGDDADAERLGQAAQVLHSSAPIITVSKTARASLNPNEFTLERHRMGGQLLKLLDQIAKQGISRGGVEKAEPVEARKSCLVVDDSQLVRTQMELLLKEYPLNVYFAEDAETALKIVKQRSFDIIFLDVMLPEMNGYKACKILKADPKTGTTPVVMLTSKKSPFNKMHGALVGCDKYLTKPVDAKKVQQVLKQYDVIADIVTS